MRKLVILTCMICGIGLANAQEQAASQDKKSGKRLTMDRILVTGLKPVAGPGGQILTSDTDTSLPSIGEWLKSSAAGVTFSEPLGNPFQIELSYRGYGVSGLLGLPQGLAFYQNGSRINESFGDVVHFDAFPDMSVDKLAIVPGANPLFGLNALGGAISATMKNGFTYKSAQIESYGGSAGRAYISAQQGNSYLNDSLALYTAISYTNDNGWRDHSPSHVLRSYTDLAYRFAKGDIGISFNSASQGLMTGNSVAPEELLEARRSSVFTWPDETKNRVLFLQGRGNYLFTEWLEIAGVFHYRQLHQNTLNGDESEAVSCPEALGSTLLCLESNSGPELAKDIDGNNIESNMLGDGDFGTLNRSSTLSDSGGFSFQVTAQPGLPFLGEAMLGGTYDRGVSNFTNSSELGNMNADRSISGSGIMLGALDPDADAYNTSLGTTNSNWSLFAGMAFTLFEGVGLELSGRYDTSNIKMEDQLGTALDGSHDYGRFNPAVELSWEVPPSLLPGTVELFARYAESSRTPSPAELACADANNPCRFPNAFLSDPPLNQVVTRGGEFGIAASNDFAGGEIEWSIGGYYNLNQDDIIFISSGAALTGSGYFDNVGDTRRAGLETLLQWHNKEFSLGASYSYIDAVFQSDFNILSPHHPGADGNGEIMVASGNRLPLVPAHSGFLRGEWRPLRMGWLEGSLGLDLYMASERFLRGDESNSTGTLPGFARLDFDAKLSLIDPNFGRQIQLFLRAENISMSQYSTFGTFGTPGSLSLSELGVGNETAYGSRFITPAAPVAVFAGVKFIR